MPAMNLQVAAVPADRVAKDSLIEPRMMPSTEAARSGRARLRLFAIIGAAICPHMRQASF